MKTLGNFWKENRKMILMCIGSMTLCGIASFCGAVCGINRTRVGMLNEGFVTKMYSPTGEYLGQVK